MSNTGIIVKVNTTTGLDTKYLFPGASPHTMVVNTMGSPPSPYDFEVLYKLYSNGSVAQQFSYFFDVSSPSGDLTDFGGVFGGWALKLPNTIDLAGTVSFENAGSPTTLSLQSGSMVTLDGLLARSLQTNTLGNIEITGNIGNDTLRGSFWHDSLTGGAGRDSLIGGEGNDTLDGGSGYDTLVGGTGNDDYWIDSSHDKIVESSGQGTDHVYTTISFTLTGNLEGVDGVGSHNLSLTGNSKGNGVGGGQGNDTLRGLDGNDTIVGYGGKDVLYGGSGKDAFVFVNTPMAASLDTIKDFKHGTDHIWLSSYYFPMPALATGPLPAPWFYKSSSGVAHDSDDRIVYNTKNGWLYYDQDGSGTTYARIHFATVFSDSTHHPSLSAGDFLLI